MKKFYGHLVNACTLGCVLWAPVSLWLNTEMEKDRDRWRDLALEQGQLVEGANQTVKQARENLEALNKSEEKVEPLSFVTGDEKEGGPYAFNVENTEESLSIVAPVYAPHNTITLNSATDKKITLHADGRVEWEGDLDTATFLFWTRVSQTFPGFKDSICGRQE